MSKTNYLQIGVTENGEVCINHPFLEQDGTGGHIIFSPEEAAFCGRKLIEHAGTAALERIERDGSTDSSGTEWLLSPSETLYSFAAWLTTRPKSITIGAEHDAAVMAEVVNQFCRASRLADPREKYAKLLALTPRVPH